MKEITGTDFYTTTGRMVVLDEVKDKIAVGDSVLYKGGVYKILSLESSSRPNGKWSVRIE